MAHLDIIVDRYVRQSRLVRENPEGPWRHDKYAEFLADVLARLGSQGPTAPPKLHIVSTVNAEVEILAVAQERVLIFDRDFGEALFVLTGFLTGEHPPETILGWGLGRMAASLTVQGDLERAFAALTGSAFIGQPLRAPVASSLERLVSSVLVQEYFAIAHECVHMAIADGRIDALAQTHRKQVQRIADHFEEVEEPESEIDSWNSPLVKMQGAAFNTMLGEPNPPRGSSREFQDWLIEQRPASMSSDVLDTARAHLGEELMCDALATELTLAAWSEKLGEEVVVEAIFNGLSNLQSLEYLRFLGQAAASRSLRDSERGLDLAFRMMLGFSTNTQAAYRRVVWRRWMYGTCEGDGDVLWATLNDLTERYAKTVSAVLQLLPEQFNSGYESMKSRGTLILNGAIVAKLLARGCDGDVLARIAQGRLSRR